MQMKNLMAAIVAAGMLAGATAASAMTPLTPLPHDPAGPILCEQNPRLCEKIGAPPDEVHLPPEGVEGTRPGGGA